MWKSEENLWESVFSVHHMSSRDQIEVVRLSSEPLNLVSETNSAVNIPQNYLRQSQLGDCLDQTGLFSTDDCCGWYHLWARLPEL